MIRAQVVDVEALGARTPAELSTYLRSHGWRLVNRDGVGATWTLPTGDDEFEILQPLDPQLRDYAARVRDAVRTLAAAEDRSELDILDQISNASMDVHSFHLHPTDQPPGLIGLDDGVLAYESVRALVSAAAYTVFNDRPRAVQPARKPQGLTEYLASVRIGPGGEGSYVVTVHTPVPPRLAAEQPSLLTELGIDLPEPLPVQRQVSVRVQESVMAAQEAAELALVSADGLDYFTAAVDRGVSANLCEALVGLGGAGQHAFEVGVAFAGSWPAPVRPLVRFRRDHIAVLRQAAAELRARMPEENVTVVGSVVRLHREPNELGEITVVGRVDDQEVERRIWMDLADSEYELAMRAHERMMDISARGNIVRRGTRLFLTSTTEFHLSPPS